MATMNFSIPDDVKKAFNEAFGRSNKSAIITELMLRAIEEKKETDRRARAGERLLARRDVRPTASEADIRKVRDEAREWP